MGKCTRGAVVRGISDVGHPGNGQAPFRMYLCTPLYAKHCVNHLGDTDEEDMVLALKEPTVLVGSLLSHSKILKRGRVRSGQGGGD